jgi:multidrug efflux pump subunit AcrA (membrane-fusion protein)
MLTKSMALKSLIGASFVLLAGVLFASAQSSAPGKYAGTAVTVEKAKQRCFNETIAFTGVLVPREDVLVRPDRDGLQVASVNAEVGDSVSSGQVLAQLTAPDGTGPTDIRAPTEGIILKASAVVGAMASMRADPLFQIVARGEFELLAQLSAKHLPSLTAGQTAKINVIGVGEVAGRVRLIGATVDGMTQTGQVRIFIGKDPRLRSGAFARGQITMGQKCGVAIPLSAVLYGQDSAIVAVVVGNERIETRQVTVGLMAEGDVEIRDGLAAGELVVVRAGAFVREGDRVRPVLASPPGGRK